MIALAPLCLAVGLTSLFILFDSLESADETLNKRGVSIVSQARVMSEFYLFTKDKKQLNEISTLIIDNELVSKICFLDAMSNTLTEQSKPVINDKVRIFREAVYSKPVIFDDVLLSEDMQEEAELLGYVHLELSESHLEKQQHLIILKVIMATLTSLSVGIIISLLFARQLMRSLIGLYNVAKDVKCRNFNTLCDEDGAGEILDVQRAFNEMIVSVQNNEEELQSKITEATNNLNLTIEELSDKNEQLENQRVQTVKLEREKAISDERERLMKDMHDGIGGKLVSSLAVLEKNGGENKQYISEVLQECLDDCRLIIQSLDANADTVGGLLADFKYRMGRKLTSMDIELSWFVDETFHQLPIQPGQSVHLLRIFQEIFTNIFKHAGCKQIVFSAQLYHDRMVFRIVDNGKGFDVDKKNEGYGQNNIQSRMLQLNGRVEIQSSPGAGCSVMLSIPKFDKV